MKFVDYYEVLGVSRDASQDDIRKAYRRLAHKYHPDVTQEPDAEEKFKDISVAYSTLKDPEKRAAYDQLGQRGQGDDFVPPQGWREQYDFGNGFSEAGFADIDLEDLLAAMAASRRAQSGGTRGGPPPIPGEDLEAELPVTLEQIYNGAQTQITLTVTEPDAQGLPRPARKTFDLNIPRGALPDQRLRLAGQGGPGYNGGRRGDLYLTLRMRDHPLFRVSGRDLYFDLPLAPWEAALGARVETATLGGTVELTIPPGTTAGRKLRLGGKGLPAADGNPGDLFAVINIAVPAKLSDKERELFTELAAVSEFRPRAVPKNRS